MKTVRPDEKFLLELRKYFEGSLSASEIVKSIDACLEEIAAQAAPAPATPATDPSSSSTPVTP